MKKIISAGLVLVFIIAIAITSILKKEVKPFYLEEDYYKESEMIDLSIEDLEKLRDEKKSFIVFVHQAGCSNSANFNDVLEEFLEDNNVLIYKVAFSNLKDTDLGEKIKYYPSFMIFKEGELIDFLKANKDEDMKYYESKEEFKNWLTKYVILK